MWTRSKVTLLLTELRSCFSDLNPLGFSYGADVLVTRYPECTQRAHIRQNVWLENPATASFELAMDGFSWSRSLVYDG